MTGLAFVSVAVPVHTGLAIAIIFSALCVPSMLCRIFDMWFGHSPPRFMVFADVVAFLYMDAG